MDEIEIAELPMLTREAVIVPASFNETDNTVDVVWTTGSRRRAYDYWNGTYYDEELTVTAAAVDMARFEAGAVQVIRDHAVYQGIDAILGIALSGEIADGEGRAKLQLSTNPAHAGVIGDIRAGIIRNLSFGYSVQKYTVTEAKARKDGGTVPLYRADKWTPHEISFVVVNADPNAGTRALGADGKPEKPKGVATPCELVFTRAAAPIIPKESIMTEEEIRAAAAAEAARVRQAEIDVATRAAIAAEQTRGTDIRSACARHGLAAEAEAFVRDGLSVADVNAKVLDILATRNAAGNPALPAQARSGNASEHETRLAGMVEMVLVRSGAPEVNRDRTPLLTDNGRQFAGMSLVDMGREILQGLGRNTRGMSKSEVVGMMLQVRSGVGMQTVSDFPSLMANVANKRLRAAYSENPGTYRQWARKAPNLPDFKAASIVQLSAMPELLQTNEHGEFKYGSVSDGATSYSLLTYGRILPFTRQAIINDDLRGFDRVMTGYGDSAARLENRLVYAQITGNPTMSDGVALFHATHGNLGAGAAIDVATLGAGRTAMRVQKGLAGEELNITPAYLLVPAALEQVAYQYTSANYVPATAATINEFRSGGRTAVEPIVEPILDAVSASQWYLAARNGQVDTVEYAYLEGAEGVQTSMETGFDVDGVSIKAQLDFVAKVIEHRGLYRRG